ncbi:MAG: hypothetical protein ACR2LX_02755 [Jatrophihabitans sp.]
MPKSWNGTLLLYSHGYRADTGIGPGSPELSQSDQLGNGSDPVSKALFDKGYALAGSSYPSAGWAVHGAVLAAEQLYRRFVQRVGRPKHVYVWGSSLGGLITEVLAEHETWVDGAAPMCGVVAGPLLNFDNVLDAAVAIRALLVPSLKVNGWSSVVEGLTELNRATSAITKAATDTTHGGGAKIVYLVTMLGLPTTMNFPGSTPRSIASAAGQALTGYITAGFTSEFGAERQFGGKPAQSDSLAQPADAALGAVVAKLGGDSASYAQTVASAAPVDADPAARAALEKSGDPTGALRVPTVTMHTVYDPVVISSNETILRNRVAVHQQSARLRQLYIAPPSSYDPRKGSPYGLGHCAFTTEQMTGLIGVLDAFVRHDDRLGTSAVTHLMGPGLAPTFLPAGWPSGAER